MSIAATLTVAGYSFAYIFENHIELLMEKDLEVRWRELAGAFDLDSDGNPEIVQALTDPRYQLPGGGAYWRVSEGAEVKLRSRSLWDQDLEPEAAVHRSPTGAAIEQQGPNGSTVYMLERDVRFQRETGPRAFRLAVALDVAPLDALRQSFASQVGLALLVIGLVLLAGSWLQLGIGLLPLKRLREQLALVHGGKERRLAGDLPSEVEPLVDDLNVLFERQEEAIRKARERAGDLAHGLKTPLTILQGEARRARERGDREIAALIAEQVGLMRRHVDRELARARVAGATPVGGVATEARALIARLINLVQRMPRGDAIEWDNEVDPSARARMDPDDFAEVMGNLLDNARKWARARVRVSAETRDGAILFAVDDDGPGAAESVRAQMPRRGERANAEGEGEGLGLAIVVDVLARYGGSLTIEAAPLGGCRAKFDAPA